MRVTVRFFASIRERLRREAADFELAPGSSVGDLWEMICAAHPALAEQRRAVSFAVNREYVDMEHGLADGDEIAVIPPVSGGAPLFRIVREPVVLQELIDAVADPASGAIATFLGVTRNHNDGRRVLGLEYEAYAEMAVREMEHIGETARQRWDIRAIAIMHRIGRVPIGEASVGIAVSSSHRRAAFEACHFAIDRLKEVVPIWKKEYFEGGEVWIGSQTGERREPFPPGERSSR